jgi:hypothetical protein
LSNCKLGLLINFNVSLLKNGVRRVINGTLWEFKNKKKHQSARKGFHEAHKALWT